MGETGIAAPPLAGRATLVLATDLDGTFAGGTPEDRERLQRVIASRDDTLLLYVTGRSVGAARELMAEAPLPMPDLLIADVGTSVVRGREFEAVDALDEFLSRRWPGRTAIEERLAGTPGIEAQDVRPPRRVSYWLTEDASRMSAVLDRVRDRLEGMDVDVLGSAGQYVDVLPGGVNKGATLLRVLAWLNQAERTAVVAGDTLNDLALFETGLRGIIVGNAEPELKRLAGGRDRVYIARREGAAGILEGLEHHAAL